MCLFLNARCLYLREVNIHSDEPWCSSTLCVRVTCKVHKSVRRDENNKREPCHPFYRRDIFARGHSLGISSVSRDCWKRWPKTGSNSVASSFMTLGWSSSGLKALEGFKPLRSLVTPSFETTMSSMKRTDLLRNGTSLWSLLLNTSVNRPLNSSACSISEAVIPAPPLLFRGGLPWLSFFLTIDVPTEVSRICFNVAGQVIREITLHFSKRGSS